MAIGYLSDSGDLNNQSIKDNIGIYLAFCLMEKDRWIGCRFVLKRKKKSIDKFVGPNFDFQL